MFDFAIDTEASDTGANMVHFLHPWHWELNLEPLARFATALPTAIWRQLRRERTTWLYATLPLETAGEVHKVRHALGDSLLIERAAGRRHSGVDRHRSVADYQRVGSVPDKVLVVRVVSHAAARNLGTEWNNSNLSAIVTSSQHHRHRHHHHCLL